MKRDATPTGVTTEKDEAALQTLGLRRYLPVVLAVCLGVVLSLIFFNVARGRDRARLETKLGRRVGRLVVALERGIDRHMEALRATSGLFYASKKVERQEFHEFAKQILTPNLAVQALEWAPLVKGSQRAAYEEATRRDGFSGFQFTERDALGRMVGAQRRAEHYPVLYVEPLEGNEAALGFDLASDPTRLKTLERARDTGEMVATPRTTLVTDPSELHGFLVAQPIYRKGTSHDTPRERRENIMGFTLGVFRAGDVVEASLKATDVRGFDIHLYDESARAGRRSLYDHYDPPGGRVEAYRRHDEDEIAAEIGSGEGWVSKMEAGGRRWALVFHPTEELLAAERSPRAWGALAGGLLVTLMLGGYLLDTFRRGAKIERLASKLSVTNVDLHRVNRALTALSTFNKALVRAEDEDTLVREACRIITEVAGYRLAWVGYAEQDEEKSVRIVAQAGYEEGYLEKLDISWADDERGRGLTGTTVRIGETEVVRDIRTDPTYEPWREETTRRGYASTIALALSDGERVFGVLRVYASEPDAFDSDEVDLLEELAADLEYGILALRTHAERKRAEDELRKLSLAVEQSPATVIITDPDGVIEYVNPKFTEVTGYTLEEVVGQKPSILKSGRMPPELYEEMWRTITQGKEWRGELLNKKKNGELYWDFISISSIKNDRGEISHYIGVKENITERKRAEEEIRKANEELREAYETLQRAQATAVASEKLASLGRLTAGVSHEIRNPLNVIAMYLHMMRQDSDVTPEEASDLEDLQEQVRRIEKITDDLLYVARHRSQERRTIDLNEETKRVLSLLEREFKFENVQVELKLQDGLPLISADQDQLQQVIFNLLSNARDAMPDGGRLSLSTRVHNSEDGDMVELRVEDTGPGIPSDALDKLFEPFFTTKPEGKGTGLGLPICQGIVQAHGGSIRAENVEGAGAAFVVRLPVEPTEERGSV